MVPFIILMSLYMLTAFFKSHEAEKCDCEIVKFVDRIWIDKIRDIKCIRTLIIHVNKDSPQPLNALRMLTPFQQIQELFDLSNTCLEKDYLFNSNKFSTGGYNITTLSPDKSYGIVTYDYFEQVKVFAQNSVKSFPSPNKTCRIISFEFLDHPIESGEFRLIRFIFKITSTLDEIFPKVYNFSMDYFDARMYLEDFKVLDIAKLEIPAKKLYDKETKQGGFDIFLYLPENLSCMNFNATTETTANHLPDGTEAKNLTQKFIWRSREMVSDKVEYLQVKKTVLNIKGLLNDPFEMQNIRNDITRIKEDGKRNRCIGIIALIVGSVSFVVAIMFGKPIWDWISGLLK